MDKVIRNGKEFETRNGQKIGNRNEFGMGNGHKWNRIQYKKHNFFTKNGGEIYTDTMQYGKHCFQQQTGKTQEMQAQKKCNTI